MLAVMILSVGYLILRQVLQLIILTARGERANAVEVLVLRADARTAARERAQLALKPQPGTGDLAELVDHMADIGLPVEFTVEGPARRLPPGVELTVYRIVQEALTNALKHAAPTTAQVRLRYDDQSVRISVRDAGRTHGSGTADANRVGHRLIGMRERVGLYGGSLEAAGTPEEGFTVTTLLPLEAQQ